MVDPGSQSTRLNRLSSGVVEARSDVSQHGANTPLDELARVFHEAYGQTAHALGWGGPGWQSWDVLPEAGRAATRDGVLALLVALEE